MYTVDIYGKRKYVLMGEETPPFSLERGVPEQFTSGGLQVHQVGLDTTSLNAQNILGFQSTAQGTQWANDAAAISTSPEESGGQSPPGNIPSAILVTGIETPGSKDRETGAVPIYSGAGASGRITGYYVPRSDGWVASYDANGQLVRSTMEIQGGGVYYKPDGEKEATRVDANDRYGWYDSSGKSYAETNRVASAGTTTSLAKFKVEDLREASNAPGSLLDSGQKVNVALVKKNVRVTVNGSTMYGDFYESVGGGFVQQFLMGDNGLMPLGRHYDHPDYPNTNEFATVSMSGQVPVLPADSNILFAEDGPSLRAFEVAPGVSTPRTTSSSPRLPAPTAGVSLLDQLAALFGSSPSSVAPPTPSFGAAAPLPTVQGFSLTPGTPTMPFMPLPSSPSVPLVQDFSRNSASDPRRDDSSAYSGYSRNVGVPSTVVARPQIRLSFRFGGSAAARGSVAS